MNADILCSKVPGLTLEYEISPLAVRLVFVQICDRLSIALIHQPKPEWRKTTQHLSSPRRHDNDALEPMACTYPPEEK